MTLIDVGQGSAALLELPGGRTVLVDGGGFADNSDFDVGAAVVAPYLWRRKIATVDRMILTHPNSDHLNGLVFIANRFKVGSLWTNGEAWHSKAYRALMRGGCRAGDRHAALRELPHESVMNGVRLEVLYPPPTSARAGRPSAGAAIPTTTASSPGSPTGRFRSCCPGTSCGRLKKSLWRRPAAG
jgi:competence protein ComEC